MSKKNKKLIDYEDEKFVIYQMSFPKEYDANGFEFVKSEVASPLFGSKVPDKIAFTDNQGTRDVDYGYDFVRDEDQKHLSKQDIIDRFGSEYHEFQILDNKKIAEITGSKTPNVEEYENEEPEVVEDKKSLKEDSFISSIDDLNNEAFEEETKEEIDLEDSEAEFKINVEANEDNGISYNDFSDSMPNVGKTSIPSFLQVDENKENESRKEESAKSEYELLFGSDDDNNSNISFGDIPDLKAPEIEFEARNNAPIDRNITIEEAIRRSENNEFPDLMSGKAGPNRADAIVDDKDDEDIQILNPIKKEEIKEKIVEQPKPKPKTLKDVTIQGNDYSKYSIPWKDMFKKSTSGNDSHPEWLEKKKEIINNTLKEFDIRGEVIDYTKGPAFTLYEIMLEAGVNVKKLNNIRDNFAMRLEVKSIRILTPIPGKNTVGIEAPNDKSEIVPYGDILSDEFIHDGKPLNVVLGKLIDNSPLYQDITKMPHALVAGATQSGKSVSLNTILVSLLIKNSPETLKLIIIDPKMVEFTLYEGIPHLATPIITDSLLATEALHWCVDEMDRRYKLLARARAKNVNDYNDRRKEDPTLPRMPYIVVMVDEFNDLVMTSGAEVQDYIVRLAQKARAAGINVIIATQRPTTDVVNGTIKANIPCRIAFRVAQTIDSMTILDQAGAEELLGYGDMLIVNQGAPVRAQGAYLSDNEISAVCNYLTSKYEPEPIFTLEDLEKRVGGGSSAFSGTKDKDVDRIPEDLLYKVAVYCVENQACSVNSIQQSFSMGFNKASRVAAMLEERGIISPKQGTKPRAILVDLSEVDEMFGIEHSDEDYSDYE